jgi:hypothetical protein
MLQATLAFPKPASTMTLTERAPHLGHTKTFGRVFLTILTTFRLRLLPNLTYTFKAFRKPYSLKKGEEPVKKVSLV